MEYLDSTSSASSAALASRLSQEVASEHEHLRIKTGYFSLNGLGALKLSIDHLVQNDFPITIAIGANEQATTKGDVDALFKLIGCLRPRARLCVVSCSGGLFHPKVVHLTRTDGSQLAYVGSANLTPNGFNGANVEAGILLDSRHGDPLAVLGEIAASVDDLFTGTKDGITKVVGPATTQQLVSDGVLSVIKPPQPSSSQGGASNGGSTASRMKRKPLITFPSLVAPTTVPPTPGAATQTSGPVPQAATQVGSGDILIAEIGKGVRWKQANFPLTIMRNYFRVNPTVGGSVNLIPVAATGAASPPVATQVVSVKSQNYRLELGSVAGLPYPAKGRPIAVFRRTAAQNFRYRVFLPGDSGHSALSASLANLYTGPARQLRRVTVTSADLQAIWAGCPV